MAKINYAKLDAEKQKISQHFKKEKKKVWLIFIVGEPLLLAAAWLICSLAAPTQPYIWFVISLLFTLVFPITQFSKKMKELTRQEKEQIGFAEQEY